MKILINNQEAVLKADASFEYVSENPLFTEAEDYTLEIPFPLKDCPQNIAIFGPLHVQGVDLKKLQYPCEIQCSAFSKSGILTITSVSETEVKGQFLEGMSQQNFASSLPDVYLTDLDFSQWDGTAGGWENYENSPEFGWEEITVYNKERDEYLTGRHIYLSHLIKLVAKAAGWNVDMSALEAIPMFKYILVANRRIETNWKMAKDIRSLALSLPYWTIKEFFRQVELFFGCVCVLSDSSKTATFRPCSNILTASSVLPLEVTDNFTVELMSSEEQSSYRGNKGLKLPDECNPDKINACQLFLNDPKYSTLIESLNLQDVYDIVYRASRGKVTRPPFISEFLYGLPTTLMYYLPEIDEYALVSASQDVFVKRDEATSEAEHRFQLVDVINQYRTTGDGEELGIAPCPISHHIVNTDEAVESVVESIPYDFTGQYAMTFTGAIEPVTNARYWSSGLIATVPLRDECYLSGTLSASFTGLNWGKIWSNGGVAGREVMYEMQILVGGEVVASAYYGAFIKEKYINGISQLELEQIGENPHILDTDIELSQLVDKTIYARVRVVGQSFRESEAMTCQLWCTDLASRGKIIGAGVVDRSPMLSIPTDPEEVVCIGYDGVGYFEPKTALERIGEAKVEEKDKYFKNLWVVLYSAQEGETKKFAYTKKYEQAVYTVPVSDREGGWLMEDEKVKVYPFSAPFLKFPYTLTPADPAIQELASLPKINETKLYRYSFLATTLPAPTSIFLIKGKKYACLRLTAHFTVNGMSQLVEGEFYEITD